MVENPLRSLSVYLTLLGGPFTLLFRLDPVKPNRHSHLERCASYGPDFASAVDADNRTADKRAGAETAFTATTWHFHASMCGYRRWVYKHSSATGSPTGVRTMKKLKIFTISASVVALLFLASPAFAATSVSQFGITWTFNRDYPTGQFANGDWWVVGPVTITSISPRYTVKDGETLNGSMLNPAPAIAGAQGWDSRLARYTNQGIPYSDSLNVARSFPFTVSSGSSLLSAASYDPDRPAGVNEHYPYIRAVAVLTVLANAPAAGSFRPPYVGTNKSIPAQWNTSRINYNLLNHVAPLSSTPSLATVLQYAVEPQIEIYTGWKGRYMHPAENYLPTRFPSSNPNYGQAIANAYGAMLLAVNMNYTNAQKEPLVIRLIQMGIDIYGTAINTPAPRHGVLWQDGGGHNQGRKMPMLFAGVMLNDAAIIERADHGRYKIFQEDSQFFYMTASDVSMVHTACCDRVVEQYTTADIGIPEWGADHIPSPTLDNKRWAASYRDIAGSSTMPHVLAAKLMGVQNLWNQPAIFEYYDQRFFPLDSPSAGSGNHMEAYVRDLWVAYKDAPSPSGSGSVGGSAAPSTPRNLRIY
jgi:hypothetical protein